MVDSESTPERPSRARTGPVLNAESDRRFARAYWDKTGRWPKMGYEPDAADYDWVEARKAEEAEKAKVAR